MGKLIVIEGADGAGKGTQSALLMARLVSCGYRIEAMDFPQYESTTAGKILGECLDSRSQRHGDFLNLSPYIKTFMFMADRLRAVPRIREALNDDKIVICNRYVPSNMAYGGAQLEETDRENYFDFVERLEYAEHEIPRPTLVIYLSVPTAISAHLIDQKGARSYLGGEGKDVNESNVPYQTKVALVYEHLSRSRPGWVNIDCTIQGSLRSREDIHALVWSTVAEHIAQ